LSFVTKAIIESLPCFCHY